MHIEQSRTRTTTNQTKHDRTKHNSMVARRPAGNDCSKQQRARKAAEGRGEQRGVSKEAEQQQQDGSRTAAGEKQHARRSVDGQEGGRGGGGRRNEVRVGHGCVQTTRYTDGTYTTINPDSIEQLQRGQVKWKCSSIDGRRGRLVVRRLVWFDAGGCSDL